LARGEVGLAFDEARVEVAAIAAEVLPDTCRLIVGAKTYNDVPCKLKGGSRDLDSAPYRIRFAWGSPAVTGAAVVMDEIEGRPELTLQIVGPADSSTALWQDWQAIAGPLSGRQDVGF
jgi:hypothetical protein